MVRRRIAPIDRGAGPDPGPAPPAGRFPWLTFLFLAAVFFLCQHDLFFSKKGTEAFNPSEADLVAEAVGGSATRRAILLSLGIFAVASLVRRRGARLRAHGPLAWTMLSFAGWAGLSLAWAEDASLTIRRLAVFAIVCLAAAAIARRCSLREILLLTFCWSTLFLLIGISAELALGTFRPLTPGYRFAGTLHPNHQGINCALLLLSAVAAGDVEKGKRTVFRACALLGLVFLILTGSRTAFAAAGLALAAYAAVWRARREKILLGLALGAALCFLLLLLGDPLLPGLRTAVMLGRDAPTSAVDSFNGRTEIWEGVERYIHRRPVLGYGYGGFWTQRHIADVSAAEKWGVAESHSAYLECLLDLGLVGLGAYVAVLLAGIGRAFALHRASGAPAAAFSGAFLVFCAAHGLLESAFVLSLLPVFLTLAVLIELGFRRPDAWRRREAPTGWQRSKGQPSRAEGLVPGVRAAPGLTQARNRVSVR